VHYILVFLSIIWIDCVLASGVKNWLCGQNPPSNRIKVFDKHPGFDKLIKNSLWPSWLTLKSYKTELNLLALKGVGIQKITLIKDKKTSTFGFLGETETETILMFEGTTSAKDLLIDVLFQTKPDALNMLEGKIHSGFALSAMSVWNDLLRVIPRYKPITVVGHSLGAAVATIIGARLELKGYSVNGVYAFSSPRVGNEEFAAHIDQILGEKFLRFQSNMDIVTHLPPKISSISEAVQIVPQNLRRTVSNILLEGNYQHIGNAIEFNGSGDKSYIFGDQNQDDVNFFSELNLRNKMARGNPILWSALQYRLIADHFPAKIFCDLKMY
jgi:Lipase (class 3)